MQEKTNEIQFTDLQLENIAKGINKIPEDKYEVVVNKLLKTKLYSDLKEMLDKSNGYSYISFHHHDAYPPEPNAEPYTCIKLHKSIPNLINRERGWIARDFSLLAELNVKTKAKSKRKRTKIINNAIARSNRSLSMVPTPKHGEEYMYSILMNKQGFITVNDHRKMIEHDLKTKGVIKYMDKLKDFIGAGTYMEMLKEIDKQGDDNET